MAIFTLYMVPKKHKLTTSQVSELFNQRKLIHGALLSLTFAVGKDTPAKFSFVASKKTAKTAVSRNSLRRKGYAALAPILSSIPTGTWGVFTIKKVGSEVTVAALSQEIQFLLKKAGI